MQIKVIEVPAETVHYVRPAFTSQWHIAVGHGRKPSGKTICGIKRDKGSYWADTSISFVTSRPDICQQCTKEI